MFSPPKEKLIFLVFLTFIALPNNVAATDCTIRLNLSANEQFTFEDAKPCTSNSVLSNSFEVDEDDGNTATLASASFSVWPSRTAGNSSASVNGIHGSARAESGGSFFADDGIVFDATLPEGALIPTSVTFTISYSGRTFVDPERTTSRGDAASNLDYLFEVGVGSGDIQYISVSESISINTAVIKDDSGLSGGTKIYEVIWRFSPDLPQGSSNELNLTELPTFDYTIESGEIPVTLNFDVPNGAPVSFNFIIGNHAFAHPEHASAESTFSMVFQDGATIWSVPEGATANVPSLNIFDGIYQAPNQNVKQIPFPNYVLMTLAALISTTVLLSYGRGRFIEC